MQKDNGFEKFKIVIKLIIKASRENFRLAFCWLSEDYGQRFEFCEKPE